jgi:hypothetical protein
MKMQMQVQMIQFMAIGNLIPKKVMKVIDNLKNIMKKELESIISRSSTLSLLLSALGLTLGFHLSHTGERLKKESQLLCFEGRTEAPFF